MNFSTTDTIQLNMRGHGHARSCGCAGCRDESEDGIITLPNGFSVGQTPGTASTISVGQSISGNIHTETDEDWYAISLSAGQTINITLNGTTLNDPLLLVYNAGGNVIAGDDDGGPGLNSQLTFTASSSGTYFISAGAFDYLSSNNNTGNYVLSVNGSANPPPPSGNNLPAPLDNFENAPNFSSAALDAISWDTRLDDNVVTVYFARPGETADGYTSEGWNAYEIGQVQAAFDTIEAVTNLRFNVVNSATNVDMQLILDTNEFDSLGFFNPPGTFNGGVGVFNGSMWDRNPGGDLSVGGFGFVTVVHELLHGLGFAHPHDGGGASSVMPGVSSSFDDYGNFDLNQGIFTTMSYNSGYHTGTSGSSPTGTTGTNYGFEAGPMALDIAVLQALYGANTTHASGNSTYVLPTGTGQGVYWSSIWDSGGIDAIRHSGTGAARIDLREATLAMEEGGGGYVSAVNGVRGGFTIANGAVIENAFGNSGQDYLVGNAVGNRMVGFAGNDTILGGAGNDTLDAGQQADRVFGGIGNDTVYGRSGFDFLDGGVGNDFLDGGRQADNIYGRGGNDTLVGGQGFDRLFGGNNDDAGFGGAGSDALFGMRGNDRLFGQADNDRVFGGGGNDLMFGHNGNDQMWGGAGFDTINGGAGDDRLRGNFNADTFVFTNGHGNDTVQDFAATNAIERLDFSGLSTINTLSQALAASTQVGANVVINTGAGSSVTLLNVNRSDLDGTDFLF